MPTFSRSPEQAVASYKVGVPGVHQLVVHATDGGSPAIRDAMSAGKQRLRLQSTASTLVATCTPGSFTEVTPCTESYTWPANTDQQIVYTVRNNSGGNQIYDAVCEATGGVVTLCSSSPAQVDVAGGGASNVTVTYHTSSSGGTGSVYLYAFGSDDVAVASNTLTVTSPPPPPPPLSPVVTPDGEPVSL